MEREKHGHAAPPEAKKNKKRSERRPPMQSDRSPDHPERAVNEREEGPARRPMREDE